MGLPLQPPLLGREDFVSTDMGCPTCTHGLTLVGRGGVSEAELHSHHAHELPKGLTHVRRRSPHVLQVLDNHINFGGALVWHFVNCW